MTVPTPPSDDPPIREFADRGTLWLLESPENLRGLVRLLAADIESHLDFTRAQRINRSFIPDDLAKLEADLLYSVPYREGHGQGETLIYVLLEHQSRPDRTMGLRLLGYMIQIWQVQRRGWEDARLPRSRWRLNPVLPIVFYTGKRRWSDPIGIESLMDVPAELRRFTPTFETLFLNLRDTPPERLMQAGTAVALALRTLQASDAPHEELVAVLGEVLSSLDALPEEALVEIRRALQYLFLLVHHVREPEEQNELNEVMMNSVERLREEATVVRRTSAQVLMEQGRAEGLVEGREEGRSEMRALLRDQMESKFGPLSEAVRRAVEVLTPEQVRTVGVRILSANTLADLGLPIETP